jgi:D-3-phosphoglycerate dehydrogenase
VFANGKAGNLRAAVKWGVGVDNVDFEGAKACGIPVTNTPGMFSDEVADMAAGYLLCMTRKIIEVNEGVRAGKWPKPAGMSLRGKKASVLGYGNIGRETVNRLLAFGMEVTVYDPFLAKDIDFPKGVTPDVWPNKVDQADVLILACALTPDNTHLINEAFLQTVKPGLLLVNISRGPLIDEAALVSALKDGRVGAAALDVFEVEPMLADNSLRDFSNCIFGSHNGSNTQEAVDRTSEKAINLIHEFLSSSNE